MALDIELPSGRVKIESCFDHWWLQVTLNVIFAASRCLHVLIITILSLHIINYHTLLRLGTRNKVAKVRKYCCLH